VSVFVEQVALHSIDPMMNFVMAVMAQRLEIVE
jgi:hypothetical protein